MNIFTEFPTSKIQVSHDTPLSVSISPAIKKVFVEHSESPQDDCFPSFHSAVALRNVLTLIVDDPEFSLPEDTTLKISDTDYELDQLDSRIWTLSHVSSGWRIDIHRNDVPTFRNLLEQAINAVS